MARNKPLEGVLSYGAEKIPYVVSPSATRRTTIKIAVHPDGRVVVDAPQSATLQDVGQALQKRARWLVEHVHNAHARFIHVLPREYVSGEQMLYIGRRYSLKVLTASGRETTVRLRGALLEVETPNTSRDVVRAHVRAWYRKRAAEYFDTRLLAVSNGLPWKQPSVPIRLKNMRRQWGNCASDGRITLNPYLVRAPRDCIDYVIAHELCHLREHNHSKAFYRLLDRAMPRWKLVKQELDEMAEVVLND